MTDALARFGFHIVSRCWCCPVPAQESISHIFYIGTMVEVVWRFFPESLGLQLRHRDLWTLLSSWKRVASRNKLLSFVVSRLPYAIFWGLWKHRNGCMHGRGSPSVPQVVYGVARMIAECLFQRCPGKHILPPC